MIAWSYGGGWQSVAIAVLIREGVLPKPDLSVIADTGREKATTWEYMYEVVQPYLAPIGIKIEVAPHTLARVDLYAKTSNLPLVPAWTRIAVPTPLFGGHEIRDGRLPGYCSGEWKRDVVERWLRLQGVKECDCWIGYSLDELDRIKNDHRNWCHYSHPLIRLGINRNGCRDLILKAGLPHPFKSRCFDCPHQTPEEWLEVKASPDEWALAVERDNTIRENDEYNGLYLYSGRVPLELADFTKDAGVPIPARPCQAGHCWT